MSGINEVSFTSELERAFGWRELPSKYTNSRELDISEQESLNSIAGLTWNNVTGGDWEKSYDVMSWMCPEAFCYYLPGVMLSSYREGEPNLIVVSNIIAMLDRGVNEEWWEERFTDRWTLLTQGELSVVEKWVWWLSSHDDISESESSLLQALGTLELLKNRVIESE